ncbi:MAG: putative ATP-grasp-modified RiPP [Pseudonocardiales bacterium]
MVSILDDPLASVGLRHARRTHGVCSATSCSATRPLALRVLQPAPDRDVPEYVYDPKRQIATDPAGAPWGPRMDKEWTSIEGTHTDGDGGDNETYDWEEVSST